MIYRGIKYPLFITVSLATLNFSSCKDEFSEDNYQPDFQEQTLKQATQIKGTVKPYLCANDLDYDGVSGFDTYGMLVPSFTVEDMKRNGFDYADLINVQIGKDIFLKDVPFVTSFNEVGAFDVCLCDYNAKGTTFGFGQLHGNFQNNIGGKVGDTITISMSKKGGYSQLYKIMHSVYDTDKDKYGTDDQFANFREVKTSGMGKGVLYRSSNPLNPKDNPVRYAYADQLASKVGIKTEIDLADTDPKIDEYLKYNDFSSTYCPKLYKSGSTVALGLDASIFSNTFMTKLRNGLLFMADQPSPYLVHCNEGKDRCGFVSLLLEALAGASYTEVADDYMVTISNFYLVKKGSVDYNMRQKLSVDRIVWLLANYKSVKDLSSIDWDNANPATVDLQKAAHDYVIDCGLTEGECKRLIDKLQNK